MFNDYSITISIGSDYRKELSKNFKYRRVYYLKLVYDHYFLPKQAPAQTHNTLPTYDGVGYNETKKNY